MWILIGVTAVLLVCDRVLKALARSKSCGIAESSCS